MSREEALEKIILNVNKSDIIVSSTGVLSRELASIKKKYKMLHNTDFLTVMEWSCKSNCIRNSSRRKNRTIYCLGFMMVCKINAFRFLKHLLQN